MHMMRATVAKISLSIVVSLIMVWVLVACSQPARIQPVSSSDALVPGSTNTSGASVSMQTVDIHALGDFVAQNAVLAAPLPMSLLEAWRGSYSDALVPGYGVSQNALVAEAHKLAQVAKSDDVLLAKACHDPVYNIDDSAVLMSLTDNFKDTILWTTNLNFTAKMTFTIGEDTQNSHSVYVGCYRPYWKYDISNVVTDSVKTAASRVADGIVERGFYVPDKVGYPFFCFPMSTGSGSISTAIVEVPVIGLDGKVLTTTVGTADFPGDAYLWCPLDIAWALADYPFKTRANGQQAVAEHIQEAFVSQLVNTPELQESMLSGVQQLTEGLLLGLSEEGTPLTLEELYPYLDEEDLDTLESNGYLLPAPTDTFELDVLGAFPDPVIIEDRLIFRDDWEYLQRVALNLEAGQLTLLDPGIAGFLEAVAADFSGFAQPYLDTMPYTTDGDLLVAPKGILPIATGPLPIPSGSPSAPPRKLLTSEELMIQTAEQSSKHIQFYRNEIMRNQKSILPHVIGVASVTAITRTTGALPIFEYIPHCSEMNCAEGYRFGIETPTETGEFSLYQSLVQQGDSSQFVHFVPIEDFADKGECTNTNSPEAESTPVPIETAQIDTMQNCVISAPGMSQEFPLYIMGDIGDRNLALNGDSICQPTGDGFARFTALHFPSLGGGQVQTCSGANVRVIPPSSTAGEGSMDAPSSVNLWMGPTSLYYGYSPSSGTFFEGTMQFVWFDPDQGRGD